MSVGLAPAKETLRVSNEPLNSEGFVPEGRSVARSLLTGVQLACWADKQYAAAEPVRAPALTRS